MSRTSIQQRERESPRISLNALSEYLLAAPARRQSILKEQKRPAAFQTTYYREVEEAIGEALAEQDEEALRKCRGRLSRIEGSDYEQTRRLSALSALDGIGNVFDGLPIQDLERRLAPSRPKRLSVEDVPVSVRPEILLRDPEVSARLGGVKLYFSTSKPLTDDRARYAGTILWRYISSLAREGEAADHQICFVVDVIAGKWFSAPRTYKRRLYDVEAACREIRALWPFL